MTSAARLRLHDERGLTLVELIITSSLAIVLMLAALMAFDQFGVMSARNNKLTTAQDSIRQQVDQMSTEIRNAQVSAAGQDPLVRADPNDIVVRNVSATGTASLIRYCLSETTRSIFRETAPDGTTPSAGCPSTSGTWNSKQISAGAIANSATDPIFTPNTTTLAAVRSVGIAIRVDTGTAGHTTRLGTGVSLRSASGRPLNLDPSAIGFTCATDGSKTALLDLLVATDPSGGPLQAAISTAAGVSIGSISAGATASIAASVQGALRIVVTNPLGIQQVLFKTVTCP